ncbi:DUF2934 domain-containing protein [Microvirga massiliensis]|uniref:DUF2934 domain-containing protein n=1 Tax=Microvirga massiliensis TaxID=1033741 RepID=UPI00093EFF18
MDGIFEQRVSERAYYLWLHDGCVQGCADRHWFQAVRDILAETVETPAAGIPFPSKRKRAAAPSRDHDGPKRVRRHGRATGAPATR